MAETDRLALGLRIRRLGALGPPRTEQRDPVPAEYPRRICQDEEHDTGDQELHTRSITQPGKPVNRLEGGFGSPKAYCLIAWSYSGK